MATTRDCPCRECADRMLLCHGRCERYQTWKTEYENEQAEKRSAATWKELSREMKRLLWRRMLGR